MQENLAWEIALNKAVDLGAKGFKIHVNIDGMVPEFLGYRMMFRIAEERGVFIIVHTGCFHVPSYKISGDRAQIFRGFSRSTLAYGFASHI